ncbi:MAG: group III truncated hemoglobin [Rhizomicrobium sp.]
MSETGNGMQQRRARIVQALVDETGIDEALIRKLVHAFYAKIRTDPRLGPIFELVIGSDWGPHLARMCDFWSSVMLMTGRYKGNPMLAHLRLDGITPDHFARWLALFRETAADICEPSAAEAFIARADNIAKSLELGMFYRPASKPAAV